MLFEFCMIVNKQGLVLWDKNAPVESEKSVGQLMTHLFIEGKSPKNPAVINNKQLVWALNKEFSLLCVAVYASFINIQTGPAIVARLLNAFLHHYESPIRCLPATYVAEDFLSFDREYSAIIKAEVTGTGKPAREPKTHRTQPATPPTCEEEPVADTAVTEDTASSSSSTPAPAPAPAPAPVTPLTDEEKAELKKAKMAAFRARMAGSKRPPSRRVPTPKGKGAKGKGKDKGKGKGQEEMEHSVVVSGKPAPADTGLIAPSSAATAAAPPRSKLGDMLGTVLSGRKEMTPAVLEEVTTKLRQRMLTSNVTPEVADQLCASIREQLAGQKVFGLASVKTHVQRALQQAIRRILSPSAQSTDLCAAVDAARRARSAGERMRPYVVVMVGINGAGKSTSLAKLLYRLNDSGFKSLVCACDTFRSGAVEQLERHCGALGAPLFAQGYGGNPSAIAKHGILQATKEDRDVVLVDTAGRMQSNRSLMQSLGKLVTENEPDMVLFVGEALAGSDGLDQLRQFDDVLKTYAKRGVDGVILSKFDTVGSKAGAALNLCYGTGLPIAYAGVGQHYPDLVRLSAEEVAAYLV